MTPEQEIIQIIQDKRLYWLDICNALFLTETGYNLLMRGRIKLTTMQLIMFICIFETPLESLIPRK